MNKVKNYFTHLAKNFGCANDHFKKRQFFDGVCHIIHGFFPFTFKKYMSKAGE